jgi:hypothetical protein
MSKRQSAAYDTPYKRARHDKLRGFYNPRNAPIKVATVTRPVTQVEATVPEQTPEHSSSQYNERMARYFKKLGAR